MTESTQKTGRAKHFQTLDSWRGASACMVVFLHFMGNNHIFQLPIISSAGFFVDFFFVLSGFVIFANYEERIKQGFGFIKFMLLRFGRLYPLHIAILGIFLVTEIIQIAIPQLSALSETKPFSNAGESYWDIASHIFLLHAIDLESVKGFNAPSWSISAEFYTYAVFALALIAFKNKTHIFCLITFITTPIVLAFIYTQHKELLFIEGFLRCLSGFSAGALCWFIWNKSREVIEKSFNNKKLIWSGTEIFLLIFGYWMIETTTLTPYKYLCVIFFSIAILVFSFEKGVVSKILNTKPFVFLGVLSYSIYMNHVFIASKIFPVAGKLIEKHTDYDVFTMVGGKEKIGVTQWEGDIISIIYFAIVIISSWITYSIIEKPFRNLFRKIAYKK